LKVFYGQLKLRFGQKNKEVPGHTMTGASPLKKAYKICPCQVNNFG
jgi:hypothetical protein